ncbi:MAG: hypothetical protein ABII01_00910 [Candidatus Woesearchaeota archaeon]
MTNIIMYVIVASFLLIFGSILYMVTHHFVHKWKEDKVKKRTLSLWLWRLTIVCVVVYISIILFLNRNPLLSTLISNFFLISTLLIFFISLIEIVIIDLLLPDIIPLWKRIIIEVLVFITLVIVTMLIFSAYSALYFTGNA